MLRNNMANNNMYNTLPIDCDEMFSQKDKYISDDSTDSDMATEIGSVSINDDSTDDKYSKISIKDILYDKVNYNDNRFKSKMKRFITGWTNYYLTNKDGIYENSKLFWERSERYAKRLPKENIAISKSYKKLMDNTSVNKLVVFLWLEHSEFVKLCKQEYTIACTNFCIKYDQSQKLITEYFGKQDNDNIKAMAKKYEEKLRFVRFQKGLHHRRFRYIKNKLNDNNEFNINYVLSIRDRDILINYVVDRIMTKSLNKRVKK